VLLRRWDPEMMLTLISSERANAAFLVPTHATTVRALSDQQLQSYDLSSLDTLYFNAAALPVPLKEWVISQFPTAGVHELYGSTEAGVVTNLRPADALRKAGSVGHAWYMTETRLLDDDGGQARPGERGELFSRSPYLMGGYLDDRAATEACTTADGFLTSGDVAVADEEGFVYIVDRKKDVIVTGGVNVYPREVEDAILKVSGVRDAAVVGSPDQKWGESVAAFVVLDPGVAIEAEDLDAEVRLSIAPFKRPRSWHFVEQLPRSAAGKVLKRELRTRLTPS
jgi:acyl-CoA synthetase (AMP-forming)/AMP-acid ligase II